MTRFNRLILAAILALGLTVAGLSVALARLGPSVDNLATAATIDGTQVNTQIAITFTEPMDFRSVERNFHILPRVAGDFSWSGNQLLFIPRTNLAYGRRYTVLLKTGVRDPSGRHLSHPFRGSFTTQRQHLLFLGTGGADRGRLILAAIGGKRQVVGPDDGLVTGYSVSLDRSLAVYAKRGSSSERPDELWLLSLSDNSTQRIFRRTDWTITQPHLSPDDRYIVFLATNVRICRPYYGCYRDTSSPQVYLFDLHAHRLSSFHSSGDVPITSFIDFSPHGQVAYTDLGSALTLANPNGTGVLHIPNRGNSLDFSGFDQQGDKAAFVGQTPSSSGGDVLVYWHGGYVDVSHGVYDSSTPAFSASGRQISYAAYRTEKGIEPIYGINVYDFTTKRTTRLTAEHEWSDWAPAWSLDSRYIAFVRSVPQEAMYLGSGEIWIMRADGSDARPLGGTGRDIAWVG